VNHLVEFLVALICYLYVFPLTFPEATTFQVGWIAKVVAFNLAAEFTCYTFWHWFVYGSQWAPTFGKFNPQDPYKDATTTRLSSEILFTTLGFLQSSIFQCVVMHLWATGKIPYYTDFWAYPMWSIGHLMLLTFWREFHFYWVHRAMHPWWDRNNGLLQGDVGAFLYRYVHSFHHKSYNPGPWSGLCMHPVEHFFYYSCTLLPLLYTAHPLHFLYVKFHADIAPIGGHDGKGEPAGNDPMHWLHHSKFECNYGTTLINFDRLFGTFVDYADYQRTGSIRAAKTNNNNNNNHKQRK